MQRSVSQPRRLRRRAAVVVILLGLGTNACSQLASADAEGIAGCFDATDCGQGDVCENFQCVTPGTLDEIAIEVTPAGGSPFVPTQFAEQRIEGGTLTVSLPEPTAYEVVVYDGESDRIDANVTFFLEDAIPGRTRSVSDFALATTPGRFRLLEGTYTVLIQNGSTPDLRVQGLPVRAQDTVVEKEFRYPERFRRISGTVRSDRSNQIRLEGVSVRAFGLESGLASTATVTNEEGQYAILLPDSGETFFRIEAEPPDSAQPTWSYQQTVRVELEQDRAFDIEMTLVNEDDRGIATLDVVGVDDAFGPQRVSGAFVTLTATVPGVEPAIFSTSGTTDGNGRVRLDGSLSESIPLIRARYNVEVLAPSRSNFGSRSTVLDLTDAGQGFRINEQVTLLPRRSVFGTIRNADGLPLSQARITFQPDNSGIAPDAPELTPADTVTNSDGRFEVLLAPGPYLMIVRPATSLGAEPFPVATLQISIDEPDPEAPGAIQAIPEFTVPAGAEVTGVVNGADGIAEANAQLEFFLVGAKALISLGEAVTDDAGRFSVILGAP